MSIDVVIALGGVDDLPLIMPVMQSAFVPEHGEAWTLGQCLGLLSMPGTILICARQGNKIVGFSLVRTVLEEAELMLIAVEPRVQGQGIGAALLQSVKEICQSQGVRRLFLEVRAENTAASLYARGGFIQVGLRKDYYRGAQGKKSDALTLSCYLD